MQRMEKIAAAVGGLVIVIVVFGAILALPVYFLWNWLMPAIFGLKKITLLQALGINLLAACLFKSGLYRKH